MTDKYFNFLNNYYSICLELVLENSNHLKNAVIIDVGSNIGIFAKCIAETLPYNHIHLFEPSKEYLEESKKILEKFSNITFNNCGLSDVNNELILYKSKDDNIGWNTLYEKDPLQDKSFLNRMNIESVKVVKLDDYYKDIEKIDFIKIDVEGYERNVLEGSWGLIEKFKPYILVEVAWGINHPDWELNKKTYEKLFSLGYEKIDLDSIENTKDVLFKPIKKLPISIGILSWNSNTTLRNTLESYERNGLFDIVNDVTIFFQECSDDDLRLSREYNIQFIAYNKNIGIGEAFFKLSQISETDNVLLLEKDWELVEDRQTTYDRLKSGIELLNSGFNCIRYRHRNNPGYPLYSRNAYEGNELEHYDTITELKSPHLIECIHWIENPEQLFSDKIQKVNGYYVTTSRWSCFTNNPCLYKKDFYIEIVNSFKNKGQHLENDISHWWVRQNFKVAFGEGLFTHNDIQKYKSTIN